MKIDPFTVNVDPVDWCCTNCAVMPLIGGRSPLMVWPYVTVPLEGAGVGTCVGGRTVTWRGTLVVSPDGAYAVSTRSVVVRSVMEVVPLAGRSPETPVIVTRAAPVVAHESVTCCAAQPEAGAPSKLLATGAAENARRVTARGRPGAWVG